MRDLYWQHSLVSMDDRRKLNRTRSCVLWFTGLSASGKSTLANELNRALFDNRIRSYVLDGDNIRHGLNKDLGFSPEDRKENIRRIGEVSSLFVDAGLIAITAFISPYREDRNMVRSMFFEGDFIEIQVKCSLEECERRDPKGLYKKARLQEIKEFTGISAPYETALTPEITVDTEKQSIAQCTNQILRYLHDHNYIDLESFKDGTNKSIEVTPIE